MLVQAGLVAVLFAVCVGGCKSVPPDPPEVRAANAAARHTEAAVICLANAAARKAGYNLADYSKPRGVYRLVTQDDRWIVYYYNVKVPDNPDGTFNGFLAFVEDRTEEAQVCPPPSPSSESGVHR
jgi:hypothetical protein